MKCYQQLSASCLCNSIPCRDPIFNGRIRWRLGFSSYLVASWLVSCVACRPQELNIIRNQRFGRSQKQNSKHIMQLPCNMTYVNVLVLSSSPLFYDAFCLFSTMKQNRSLPSTKQVHRKFYELSYRSVLA